MNNVKVKERKGYIVFSLSSKVAWQYYKKKQKDISYGAKFNSHEDLAQAYQMATILERDIEQGTFDSHNIGKYQKKSPLVKAESNFECLSLLELFDKYVEDNSNLSVTGKLQHQTKFRKPLEECPSNITIVENQYQTYKTIKKMRKTKTSKTIINILKNMIDWAKMEGLLPESTPNKFLEYSQQINKLKIPPKDKPELIKKVERTYNKSFNPTREYWSEDEVKIILSELNDRRKHTLYYQQCDVYALLIEFLFATGMRHGEAFGLTFGKIQGDLSNSEVPIKLVINESYNSKYRVIKETKTKKNRVILLSKRAHEIVKQLYEFYTTLGINVNINTSIFCKENGSNFTTADITSLWLGASTKDKVSYMGMIPRLCVEGKLPFYLKPYSTRSTFVSLQSQRNIDPQTVADYIGDNVETIFKHYYGGRDDYQPIDLF